MQNMTVHINNYFNTYTFENGSVAELPASPVQFSKNEPLPCEAAPHIGQHNEEILLELGYTKDQIDKMVLSGGVVNS